MIGIGLLILGSFFEELSNSISKITISNRPKAVYTIGFLSLIWGTLFFVGYGIYNKDTFVLDPRSFYLLIPRIILEVILAHISLVALTKADRGLFSLVRTGTIPLLLVIDLLLGYKFFPFQILGLVLVIVALVVFAIRDGIKGRGFIITLASTIIAVCTISIYKYDITHWNSVAAEQSVVSLFLSLYFFLGATLNSKENPLSYLKIGTYFWQSVFVAIGGVVLSFSYLFLTPAVATAGKRAIGVIFGLLAGKFYFKEKNSMSRFVLGISIIIGILLLSVGS